MSRWRLCAARSCLENVPAPCRFCYPCWTWLSTKLQTRIADAWADREVKPGRFERYIEIGCRRIEREKKAAGAG